ncbi:MULTISPECIES: hypothetical protein [Pseudomonas]|uniref:hypothetical protein n=1 Tax=Pseudomonas TaxID=286 RepID=UPI001C308F91|nr:MULTISPECIES: hypothetical protein [Pseudomonas]MBV2079607.1 hypothetical protein [Pseudomonas carnis]MBV2085361.1 hypothetical protein [Pseudomonas carnis]MDO3689335.1 hypothetical protein [Pseudomonas sp. DKN 2791]MDO7031280.1 hypothetical protein [Pseudomonas sp. DKN 2792]
MRQAWRVAREALSVDCELEKGFSKAKIGSRLTVTVRRSTDSHLAPYPTSTEGRIIVWSCLELFGVVYRWHFSGHFKPWNSYLIVHFQLGGLTVSTVFAHGRFVQRGELFDDIIKPLLRVMLIFWHFKNGISAPWGAGL